MKFRKQYNMFITSYTCIYHIYITLKPFSNLLHLIFIQLSYLKMGSTGIGLVYRHDVESSYSRCDWRCDRDLITSDRI